LLASQGLPIVATIAAATREEAIRVAADLGFSVAIKIDYPDILHKSDCGGVRLNLGSEDAVGAAFDEMTTSAREEYPAAEILGVTVQTMAPAGEEVIIGVSKDPQFGPLIMFGLGGIMVELLEDVSFRIAP
jgi:acyl-CoA synthetase (NDP forming)